MAAPPYRPRPPPPRPRHHAAPVPAPSHVTAPHPVTRHCLTPTTIPHLSPPCHMSPPRTRHRLVTRRVLPTHVREDAAWCPGPVRSPPSPQVALREPAVPGTPCPVPCCPPSFPRRQSLRRGRGSRRRSCGSTSSFTAHADQSHVLPFSLKNKPQSLRPLTSSISVNLTCSSSPEGPVWTLAARRRVWVQTALKVRRPSPHSFHLRIPRSFLSG